MMKNFAVLVLLMAGPMAFARGEVRPSNHAARPGVDPQSNIGSTVNDPALAPAPNAERDPANFPPDLNDPSKQQEVTPPGVDAEMRPVPKSETQQEQQH